MPQWTVNAREAGVRLDKFLAARRSRRIARARRDGARARQGLPQRARGDARPCRHRLAAATSSGSGWIGRAARSAARTLGDDRDLPIVYEDDTLIVLEQAGRTPGRAAAAAAARRRAVGVRRSEGVPAPPRPPPAVRRPPHRSRHVGPGRIREDRRAAQDHLKGQFKRHLPERVYRAVVYGHPSPAAGTWRDHLVWDDRVADSEGNAPARSARQGGDQPLPRARAARRARR